MQDIFIDNYNFSTMDAQKYWSYPSNTPYKKKKEEAKALTLSGDYIGSRKVDGFWGMIIKDKKGICHMRSRKPSVDGNYTDKAEWIPQICKDLDNVPNETVLIGEIYFPNNEGSRNVTTALGCLKEKCIERQEESGFLYFYIFDILAYNGVNIMNLGLNDRVNNYLYKYISPQTDKKEYIKIAKYKDGQELWDLYGQILEEGGEGIVIVKKNYPYEPKKRKARATIKLKKEFAETIDAFLDGNWKKPKRDYDGKRIEEWCYWYNEKTGEKLPIGLHFNEYITGSPIVPMNNLAYNDEAAAVSFSLMKNGKPEHIGWISGIPSTLRKAIVNNPESVINDVYELNGMEIQCINGKYSLRHGRIYRKRDDKTPADCEWQQIEC